MAQKTVTTLHDDIDGTEAAKTVRFGYDGVEYTIDLSDAHATALRDSFNEWVSYATRVGGRKAPARSYDAKAVREWAQAQGMDVAARGRVSSELVEKYLASV